MKIIALLWLFGVIAIESFEASAKPGDSVDSGHLLRRSGKVADVPDRARFSPIYENIPLNSQTDEDYFTEYGPFVNSANSLLKIALSPTGGAKYHDLYVAYGSRRLTGKEAIEFVVDAGDRFSFGVKGHTSISVFSLDPRLTAVDVGLPLREEFLYPNGEYVKCWQEESHLPASYLYRAGSMTDRSQRVDFREFEALKGFTTGPQPDQPVQCAPMLQDILK